MRNKYLYIGAVLIAAALCLSLLALVRSSQSPYPDLNDYRGTGAITANFVTGQINASTTEITVTDGLIITPTHSLYSLSAAGSVGLVLGASCFDGQLLFLRGDDNQTITVADTNVYTTDGNTVAIGQYDLVGWQCFSNKWYHLFKSANS